MVLYFEGDRIFLYAWESSFIKYAGLAVAAL